MFHATIEVVGREPKWLASRASPKLRMLDRTTLNAFRMPEPEGPAAPRIRAETRHRVLEAVLAIRRLPDRPGRIGRWEGRASPAGKRDAR
jgi:hypothetical protein